MKAAYEKCDDLFGIKPDTNAFEALAIEAWERIGNKHSRLYKYTADTQNLELKLPCNVEIIESVTIPLVEANASNSRLDSPDWDAIYAENYTEARKRNKSPYDVGGKYVKYTEGDGVLYFTEDYKNVTVLYHGILVDEEDGLPLVDTKEIRAIATFIAWRETYKDALKRRDKNAFTIADYLKAEWLRELNNARVKSYFTQNDMDMILDAKSRWDRKSFGKKFAPVV